MPVPSIVAQHKESRRKQSMVCCTLADFTKHRQFRQRCGLESANDACCHVSLPWEVEEAHSLQTQEKITLNHQHIVGFRLKQPVFSHKENKEQI